MDVNKIFGLFSNENTGSQETEVAISDYKDHPLFWVGMFKKLIHNHKVFNHKVMDFFSNIEELDAYDVETAGEFVVYNRAWHYISKIDLQDRICQEALIHFSDEFLETYLRFTIHYFEELEEYEKCAHLQKIHKFSVKFLN